MKTLLLSLTMLVFGLSGIANPEDANPAEDSKEYVELSLTNKSLKSIPLLIPGVMNPNLSPMSRSGVSLKIGQEVLFKYKGKKRILLVVTEDLDGQTIEVSELLRKKKKEIDQE